jgi:hypothetical protein
MMSSPGKNPQKNNPHTEDNEMAKIKPEPKAGPLPLSGIYPTILIGVDVNVKPDPKKVKPFLFAGFGCYPIGLGNAS